MFRVHRKAKDVNMKVEEVVAIKEVFDSFDADGTGTLELEDTQMQKKMRWVMSSLSHKNTSIHIPAILWLCKICRNHTQPKIKLKLYSFRLLVLGQWFFKWRTILVEVQKGYRSESKEFQNVAMGVVSSQLQTAQVSWVEKPDHNGQVWQVYTSVWWVSSFSLWQAKQRVRQLCERTSLQQVVKSEAIVGRKVSETPSRNFTMMDSDGSGPMFFAFDNNAQAAQALHELHEIHMIMQIMLENTASKCFGLGQCANVESFGQNAFPGSLDFEEFLRSSTWKETGLPIQCRRSWQSRKQEKNHLRGGILQGVSVKVCFLRTMKEKFAT